MSKITLRELFRKYLNDSITAGELSELYAAVARDYDPMALEELLEGSFSDPSFSEGSRDYDLKEVFSSLLARIKARETGNSLPVTASVIRLHPKRRIARKSWIAIAASLLLLLGAGTYTWLSRKAEPIMVQALVPAKHDVSPGHDGAILTLANGQQIVLDSAQNGSLATQGATRITKLTNGQLNYASLNEKSSEILYNTLTTPRARKTSVILADGTQVWLNAASFIKYPTAFAGKERRVEVSGEAYFEIKKDASRPFVVTRAGTNESIEVLGTQFDVNAYDDEDAMKTTLLEGSVKMIRGMNSSLLAPGQQAILANGSQDIKVIDDANIDEVMAWKNGRFLFSDMDLKTIMRQLTRWYDVDVVFEGKAPDIRIGGIIHKDVYLSTVMEFLGENGVHYKIEGKKVTILQ